MKIQLEKVSFNTIDKITKRSELFKFAKKQVEIDKLKNNEVETLEATVDLFIDVLITSAETENTTTQDKKEITEIIDNIDLISMEDYMKLCKELGSLCLEINKSINKDQEKIEKKNI